MPNNFLNSSILDIIDYHTTENLERNQKFFVVVDRHDTDAEGILVVNLNFEKYVDAMRDKIFRAGDGVPACEVGEVSWEDSLLDINPPLAPVRCFAFFETYDFRRGGDRMGVVQAMSGGLNGRKKGMGRSVVAWGKVLRSDALEDMITWWRNNAKERDYWTGGFWFANKEAWEEGQAFIAIIVEDGTGEKKMETRSVKAEAVGELLSWLYHGLITPREALAEDTVERLQNRGRNRGSPDPVRFQD